MKSKIVLGGIEAVSVPSWGVFGIDARVDTGAETSALHVENLKRLPGKRVSFEIKLPKKSRRRATTTHVVAPVARSGRVRSSNGVVSTRVFVAARVEIGSLLRRIEIGLVDRRHMTYPMLLGRSALAGYFLVDPGRERVLARG
jgi:hypothetical protein